MPYRDVSGGGSQKTCSPNYPSISTRCKAAARNQSVCKACYNPHPGHISRSLCSYRQLVSHYIAHIGNRTSVSGWSSQRPMVLPMDIQRLVKNTVGSAPSSLVKRISILCPHESKPLRRGPGKTHVHVLKTWLLHKNNGACIHPRNPVTIACGRWGRVTNQASSHLLYGEN